LLDGLGAVAALSQHALERAQVFEMDVTEADG